MATLRYEKDANLDLIKQMKVAIIGFGSQGHAHALNLHESGGNVKVGLQPGSKSKPKAEAAGLEVVTPAEAAAWADFVMLLAPDTVQPALYEAEIKPHMTAGKTLAFSHGFNIRYETIVPPADIDVVMIAPKGPGHMVRQTYTEGGGVPALVAVEQDASGQADAVAMSYAAGIGGARAGVLNTTFTEETETDLFGEQAVLCGGVAELVKNGFETLIEAGYQPESAYFECVHELKLIVDLIYRGGLRYMRYSISNTAEWGDYESGPRVVNESSKAAMKEILAEIQDGRFAKKWIEENKAGRPAFNARRQAEMKLQVEEVGRELRSKMAFVDPVDINPGELWIM